jgi:hypothetical protein
MLNSLVIYEVLKPMHKCIICRRSSGGVEIKYELSVSWIWNLVPKYVQLNNTRIHHSYCVIYLAKDCTKRHIHRVRSSACSFKILMLSIFLKISDLIFLFRMNLLLIFILWSSYFSFTQELYRCSKKIFPVRKFSVAKLNW